MGSQLRGGGAGAHCGGCGVKSNIKAICYECIMAAEHWKEDLCCNSECPMCCLACVAPWIPYYVNLSIMKNQHTESTIPMPWSSACCPACIHGSTFYAGTVGPCIFSCTNVAATNMPLCLFIVPCVMHCVTRHDIRTEYNIKGSCCEDCCTVMCCYSCALAQEHAQLVHLVKSGVNSMSNEQSSLIHPPIVPNDVVKK